MSDGPPGRVREEVSEWRANGPAAGTAPHILYPPYRRDEERSEEPRDEGTNRVTSNRRVNGKRKSAAVSRPFTRSFATRNSLILYLSSPYAPQAGAERHAERYARRTEDRRAVGETSVERRVPLRYLSPYTHFRRITSSQARRFPPEGV